jgi:hypothetical protein
VTLHIGGHKSKSRYTSPVKSLFVSYGENLLRRYNSLQSSLPRAVLYLLMFVAMALFGTTEFLHDIPNREWFKLGLDSFVMLFGAFGALDIARIIRATLRRRRSAGQ